MLQGIIRSPELFPNVPKYAAVSVAVIIDERKVQGPVAVGITLMSSEEMTSCGMKGKGVQILHTYRDHMWEFGSRAAPPVTDIASQPLEEMTVVDQPKFYNCLTLLEDQNASVEEVKENDKEITTLSEACALSIDQRPDEVSPNSSDESSEELLQRCFLAALKYRLTPKGLLPLDVGQFYSTMLLRCVPEGKRIDIKKTSYKKFANFLRAVNSGSAGEIVKIASKSKGIDNIIEINWNHSLLKSFELTDERVKDEDEVGKAGGVQKVSVNEYFAVTDPVLPLFGAVHGLQRGSLLLTPQIREIITTYAKSKGLSEGKYIRMDDPVMKCLVKTEEPIIDWNTLMQKVLTKMTKTFVITTADGRETVRKLDLPKITFKVEMRSGNKKVTLVNNLSTYGIDCKALCQQIQTEAAASATLVKDVAQCEGPQLVVQGNHVRTGILSSSIIR
ncbi:hypothetical protein AB6A40_009940 [Gnathostoma spinigerum]|uniref:SUI1 domain-containing protein n=1 Tax=Gnathostoma spinigerum TaxID=75299 RepID=A0ABD6F052_9BILA